MKKKIEIIGAMIIIVGLITAISLAVSDIYNELSIIKINVASSAYITILVGCGLVIAPNLKEIWEEMW